MRRLTLVTGALLALGAVALGSCGKKPLPALSAIVDAPYLRPGSSWTYRVEDTTWPRPATVTLTFVKEDVYKNAGVLSFSSGTETILYDRDLNFVAVASNGRIIREAAPSLRSFDFPFYVNKTWRSVFTFQDNQKGLSWTPVEVFWRVKEYDQIEVPAGKFRAFLLVSEPSTNWGIRKEEVWYAPEVGQLVKRIRERTAAHYEGKGKDTWQLVQYSLK
ncbi:MAG TPA: hypothetical protein VLD61_06050 [Methylomirabilota bacterium]|nr:hypothetical protein [Methylomirabilota bacterium]